MPKQPTIYLASDHAGFQLKKRLVRYLENELKLHFEDMGPKEFDEKDDFPDYVVPACEKAVKNKGKAILVCGSGIGACISANKVKGMYAGLAYNLEAAELSRKHNNTNGICLAGRVLTEEHAMAIVKKWLETDFSGEEKYERRNQKLKKYED